MAALPLAKWAADLAQGDTLSDRDAQSLAACDDLDGLMDAAGRLRDTGHGDVVTVSRKVFIPLTKLCRDACGYCTFAQPPRRGQAAFLSPDEVLGVARAGVAAGCDEALFTLGDKPELRYRAARQELAERRHATTLSYLGAMAALVLRETGLLPHLNAGVMDEAQARALRQASVSQGLMLETAAARLSERGGPHAGAPDKLPSRRLATIEAAGRAKVPFTSGLLIGIGETRHERIEAMLALRSIHARHGHVQEIIVQNFRAKPGTRMATAPEPTLDEHLWTIAVARLVFGPTMSIQAPPNLRAGALRHLIAAGINDWGGVSPVTPDHVNPEAAWPALTLLADETRRCGKTLAPRLAAYPSFVHEAALWIDPAVRPGVLRRADGHGLAHETGWRVGRGAGGESDRWSDEAVAKPAPSSGLSEALDAVMAGRASEAAITQLFAARGPSAQAILDAADGLRREVAGDTVSYVVTRNINYTNVCFYRCRFCAFSKGKAAEHLRGRPYDLDLDEVARRAAEAWERGATEVCLQGGIHPDYTGDTYLAICRAIRRAVPGIHIHAFSPLEIAQGARTLGLPLAEFLVRLREAGLATLPGTAAEILDDEVRRTLCADKLTTAEWLAVIEAAHRVGLKSTATIMFGHIEGYRHWARHLLRVRSLQQRTGGFTEFVPLPFVHMEAPIYLTGEARQGPSRREALLMHAVARLVLHPLIPNIQVSWVKMGEDGVAAALAAGANDLGGTLMNESISRAAGAEHGQEMSPAAMERAIRAAGRHPRQRTTLYGDAPPQQVSRSFGAPPLAPLLQPPARKRARIGSAALAAGA